MFCTKCGSYVPDGQHFCTSCGAPMEEFGPADAAPAQPTYQQPGQTQQGYGQPASVTDASDLPPYMPPVDVPGSTTWVQAVLVRSGPRRTARRLH